MEVEPYTTYVQKENVIYNSVSDLTVGQNLPQDLCTETWMSQQHWKRKEILYRRLFIETPQRISSEVCSNTSACWWVHSSFFPRFAFFLWKMCYSLGRRDRPHTTVFPGKEVVPSLPFAVLALEILVLSVTCSYFDALDTMMHTFGRPEECYIWTKMKHSSTDSHFFLIHMLVTCDLSTDHHGIPQIAEDNGREDLV